MRLIQTIQSPARGIRARKPDDVPTATSKVHMPSENTNRYRKPSTALFVVDTHVSTAAMTGAEHGAATNPDIPPISRAPEYVPPLPAADAFASSHDGMRTGMT